MHYSKQFSYNGGRMINHTITLLVAFQLKHLLADFVFQNTYMVIGKGKKGWGFVPPLACHCFVHIVLTTVVICLFMGVHFLWLLPVEFIIHFIIDRLKSGPKYGGRYSMSKSPKTFWVLFGVDQLLHQLTYIFFICWI